MAYLKNNQKAEAEQALTKALELGDEFPGRKQAEKALQELK
jgi:hypothetical protein